MEKKLKFTQKQLADRSALQVVLRGAALPGMIVALCAVIGFFYGVYNQSDIVGTTKIGVGLGLFFSLWGGLELMVGILISSKDIRTNGLLALGYFLVWATCLWVIFA